MTTHWIEHKPHLIPLNIPLYLKEIQRQADYVNSEHRLFIKAVNKGNGHEAFRHLSSFLHFSTQAFLIVWPQQKARLRGRWIRVALRLNPSTQKLYHRQARNCIAHRDTELDELLLSRSFRKSRELISQLKEGQETENLRETNQMELVRLYPSVPRFDDEEFGKQTETYIKVSQWKGTKSKIVRAVACGLMFDITDLDNIVNDLSNRADTALGSSWATQIYLKSKGDIKTAEALAFE